MKKFVLSMVLAFTMVIGTIAPAMNVKAASNEEVERRYIIGDGVRLRKEGHVQGTILELMYNQEPINFYPQIYGTDTEYNYMQRVKTGTYGYVDHNYTNFGSEDIGGLS